MSAHRVDATVLSVMRELKLETDHEELDKCRLQYTARQASKIVDGGTIGAESFTSDSILKPREYHLDKRTVASTLGPGSL